MSKAIFILSTLTPSDIDECANGLDILCDENARCTNTNGSYECNCEDGYIGDGVSICVSKLNLL